MSIFSRFLFRAFFGEPYPGEDKHGARCSHDRDLLVNSYSGNNHRYQWDEIKVIGGLDGSELQQRDIPYHIT